MGTNFYWRDVIVKATGVRPELDADDPAIHIGKRSAAGPYCWDCDLTLCFGGAAAVHTGATFADACPRCDSPSAPASLASGAAGVELGFAAPNTERPTGVATAASFSWAQEEAVVVMACKRQPNAEIIVDEYGRTLTGREFLDMLEANCPLQFTDGIGSRFS